MTGPPRIIRSGWRHKDLRAVAIGGFFGYQRRIDTVIDFSRNLWNALGCVVELAGYLLRFVSAFFRTRAALAARLLAAESQLSRCQRRIDQKLQPKPRFTTGSRLLWVALSKLWTPWRIVTQLMQPATVVGWHRLGFRLYWRWKSRRKAGHPPITQEMQGLIRKLSRENPLWGPGGQIRDNLLLLRPASAQPLPSQRPWAAARRW